MREQRIKGEAVARRMAALDPPLARRRLRRGDERADEKSIKLRSAATPKEPLMFVSPAHRKVFEGVASRHEMYALFNRHSQAPFDEERVAGTRYVGEWFEISEASYDQMFEILPPLFYRGDMFAMREFLAASVTSVFFALTIDDRSRWFHGYCDLSDRQSPDRMRAEIIGRESRPVRAMNAREKLDHIWSTTGPDFRGYADGRFPADLRNRQIVLVYPSAQGKIWKLLDDLTDEEIAAKLPVQFRRLPETVAA